MERVWIPTNSSSWVISQVNKRVLRRRRSTRTVLTFLSSQRNAPVFWHRFNTLRSLVRKRKSLRAEQPFEMVNIQRQTGGSEFMISLPQSRFLTLLFHWQCSERLKRTIRDCHFRKLPHPFCVSRCSLYSERCYEVSGDGATFVPSFVPSRSFRFILLLSAGTWQSVMTRSAVH